MVIVYLHQRWRWVGKGSVQSILLGSNDLESKAQVYSNDILSSHSPDQCRAVQSRVLYHHHFMSTLGIDGTERLTSVHTTAQV
jgi:hypothetical protein